MGAGKAGRGANQGQRAELRNAAGNSHYECVVKTLMQVGTGGSGNGKIRQATERVWRKSSPQPRRETSREK